MARVEIDGVEQTGLFRLQLNADVNDAIKLQLWRFAKVDIEVNAEVEDVFKVAVAFQRRVYQALGDGTLPGALRALADAVESEQTAPASGTVNDS